MPSTGTVPEIDCGLEASGLFLRLGTPAQATAILDALAALPSVELCGPPVAPPFSGVERYVVQRDGSWAEIEFLPDAGVMPEDPYNVFILMAVLADVCG
jgi:hypothetical protein